MNPARHTPALLVALVMSLAPAPPSDGAPARAPVQESIFGTMPDGNPVRLFTLTNRHGLEARVMALGATLVSLRVPDRRGAPANVTLSLDSLDAYLEGHPLLGSVVGRYANRIDTGGFTIDGTRHELPAGTNKVHIHGGPQGFHKRLWDARPHADPDAAAARFSLRSEHGDMGYPGTLEVDVLYRLDDTDALVVEYTARADRPTHVNLTNHAYFNLGGAASGDVLSHTLQIAARRSLEVDDRLVPTGRLLDVAGTPLDFLQPRRVGERIRDLPKGYDHCYALDGFPSESPFFAARLVHPQSGRVMEVATTAPGVQLYTANHLDGRLRGDGVPFTRHIALCLETQHFPDTPNKPSFPTTLLRPGQTYRSITVFRFSVARAAAD